MMDFSPHNVSTTEKTFCEQRHARAPAMAHQIQAAHSSRLAGYDNAIKLLGNLVVEVSIDRFRLRARGWSVLAKFIAIMNRSELLGYLEEFFRLKSLTSFSRTHMLGKTEYIDISDKFILQFEAGHSFLPKLQIRRHIARMKRSEIRGRSRGV
jgi:hypothetical protein